MATIKSTSEIISLDQLLFPVEVINNPNQTNSEYSKIVVGQTYDNGEMHLNYCSPVYELVPNTDIFPNVEDILKGNDIPFTVTYRHINHVRFYADYIITDDAYAYRVQGGDLIRPSLSVQHSYNGLTKYAINFGYFRLVCSNGLVIPLEEMNEFNLSITGKHTRVIQKSFALLNNMLVNFANNAKQITTSITHKFEVIAERAVLNPEDRLKEVLASSGIIAVENSKFNTVEDIMGRIRKEANDTSLPYNGQINDWLIYNGINQYINDDTLNKKVPEKRREIDQQVFGYILENA
ncbi:MAG: DUF932 domain-containing protein [bacterium]